MSWIESTLILDLFNLIIQCIFFAIGGKRCDASLQYGNILTHVIILIFCIPAIIMKEQHITDFSTIKS